MKISSNTIPAARALKQPAAAPCNGVAGSNQARVAPQNRSPRRPSLHPLTDVPRGNQPRSSGSPKPSQHELGDLRDKLSRLQQRQEHLATERERLQDRLHLAERRAGVDQQRHPFDLSKQDWLHLAKEDTLKFRVPCELGRKWRRPAQPLIELGLDEGDFESILAAYRRSNARIWQVLQPQCVRAMRGTPQAARALGMRNCWHLTLGSGAKHGVARLIAEAQAGLGQLPQQLSEQEQLYQTLATEPERFEADLAQSFGPDEAHRLHYSQGLCYVESTYRGKPSTGPYDATD